jgi:hypothetical protein
MNFINLPLPKYKKYKNILDKDKTYYYTSVVHPHEVANILETVPSEVIDLIKKEDVYLLISNEWECFDTVVEEIYKVLIIYNNIPEHKIVFLSGAVEIKDISKNITKKINEQYNKEFIGIDSRFFAWFEYAVAHYYHLSSMRFRTELKRREALDGKIIYKKLYLLFNNRWRFHRPILVALLKIKNLLDSGFVSLGANDGNYNWDNIYDILITLNKDHTEIYNLLLKNKNFIIGTPDLILDTENKNSTYYNNYFFPSVSKYFENSFMSVVTETYFYGTKTKFLSEKTFKPIAFLQPFILVSVPYSLEVLRDLGYKTFHPYINESYDIEENDAIRMKMIVDEIQRLSKLSDIELKVLSRNLRDICIHNQKILLSKSL